MAFSQAKQYTRPVFSLSDEQKENLSILKTDLQASIDGPPSEESVNQLVSTITTAFSDRTVTQEEWVAIFTDTLEVVKSTGITQPEARKIFYDFQNIVNASRLPKTNDILTGTDANDVLYGGSGDDILTGTVNNNGVNEIDVLTGGGGHDTFVLGNATTTFYNDGRSLSVGANDYALIVDFNSAFDTIQLHGNLSDYTLGAIQTGLGLTGTAIYSAADTVTPELIGIVVGVTLTDFSTGFTTV